MSAQVSADAWGWFCLECGDGSDVGAFATEARAHAEAAKHDQESHAPGSRKAER